MRLVKSSHYVHLSSPTKGCETNSVLLVWHWFQEMTLHLSHIRTAWQICGSAQTLQDLRQPISLWGFYIFFKGNVNQWSTADVCFAGWCLCCTIQCWELSNSVYLIAEWRCHTQMPPRQQPSTSTLICFKPGEHLHLHFTFIFRIWLPQGGLQFVAWIKNRG